MQDSSPGPCLGLHAKIRRLFLAMIGHAALPGARVDSQLSIPVCELLSAGTWLGCVLLLDMFLVNEGDNRLIVLLQLSV